MARRPITPKAQIGWGLVFIAIGLAPFWPIPLWLRALEVASGVFIVARGAYFWWRQRNA
jgi:hypothetical protein